VSKVIEPDDPRHPGWSEFEDWIAGMSDEEYAKWLKAITKQREEEKRREKTQ